MHKYVIMGVQGCGKGTQAHMLVKDFDLVHISIGDIFRWNIQNHTKLAARVKRLISEGQLVGDDLVEQLVRDRLAEHDWNFGFILDGFPRTVAQAEALDEMLKGMGQDIDHVVSIEVPDSALLERLTGRRMCSCGASFHVMFNKPKQEGICDLCGGKLYHRDDDKEEAITERLVNYHRQTAPLIDFYTKKGKVRPIPGTGSVDDIFAAIMDAVKG